MSTAVNAVVSTPAKQDGKSVVADEMTTIRVNAETASFIHLAFEMQDQYENESKFERAFLYDAAKARLAYVKSACIATWERTIDKYSKNHPKLTREQCIAELLEARVNRDLKKLADNASAVK